jgi:hypothetical protein
VGLVIIAFSVVTWVGIQQLGYSEFSELHRQLKQRLFQDPRAVVKNIYLAGLKSEFADARDLGGLWTTLTATAARFEFCQVELALVPPARDLLQRFARLHPVPPGFPRWRASGSPETGGRWSWTIPIVVGDTPAGELRLSRHLRAKNGFELSHLLAALVDGFVPRFVRLLDESRSFDPHPIESLDRQPAPPET